MMHQGNNCVENTKPVDEVTNCLKVVLLKKSTFSSSNVQTTVCGGGSESVSLEELNMTHWNKDS